MKVTSITAALALGVLVQGESIAQQASTLPASFSSTGSVAGARAQDDLTDLAVSTGENYWLPAIEVVGVNLGVWSYNKFLTKAGWSDINWETIKRNFRTGFRWDYDGYLTNQFMHPYHGSAYYSTARVNGLGFWESAPYAFGGSLMWEYFMEDEPPSYNDIVNTPVTGIILGEISLRVSDVIIDESAVGLERVVRETGALVINPIHALSRLFRGEVWKSGPAKPHPDFFLRLSMGGNTLFVSRKLSNNTTYAFLGLDFGMGDPLEVSRHKNPFDFFVVHSELSLAKDDNIVGIFASGVLWDTRLTLFGNPKDVLGAYKEVDILINTVYKLSATSLTGQLIDNLELSSAVGMQNSLSVSAILMGATNSEYASEYGKDYNIGPGASARISSTVTIRDFGRVQASYKRYWIHTLSGAVGEEFVGVLKFGTVWELTRTLALGSDFLLYERFGNYREFPDTKNSNSAVRIYAQFTV
ncbi:MAG: DUF3943 domain-containing protein [Bacteroidota bacterium]